MYCGKDIIVQEAIQKAVGPTLDSLLNLARNARAARNFQEAYTYFTRVLELDPVNVEAWLCKGESAGWLSTLANFRFDEMMAGILNAVCYSSTDRKNATKVIGADIMNRVGHAFIELNIKNLKDFSNNNIAKLGEFLATNTSAMKAYESAHFFDPTNKQVINNMINLCQMQINTLQRSFFNRYRQRKEEELFYMAKMSEFLAKRQALESAVSHQ